MPKQVFADDHNYQNYVIGESAAGMGGAYTAFSESPDGTYYNPGGVAFAEDDSVSFSANVARYTTGNLKNRIAISLGSDTIRDDLKIAAFQIIPASAVTLKSFDFPWEEKNKAGKKKNAIALSFYVPDSVLYTGTEEVTGGASSATITFRLDDSLLLAGPTYSRQLSDRLGIGISVFYAYRAFLSETFLSASNDTEFQHLFSRANYNYAGLTAVLGVKWKPTDEWHFGASVRPYSFRLYGGGENIISSTTEGATSETNPNETILRGLKVNLTLPMKMTAGIGYRKDKKYAVTGDVNIYLPNEFSSIQDPQGRATDATIKQNFVINGNMGGEYWFHKYWPVRVGAFTNYSASPSIGSSGAAGSVIDYFGGTMAVSFEKKPFATHLGVQALYGSGKHLVGSSIEKFSLLHLTASVGSSFRF